MAKPGGRGVEPPWDTRDCPGEDDDEATTVLREGIGSRDDVTVDLTAHRHGVDFDQGT